MGVAYLLYVKGFVYIGKSTPFYYPLNLSLLFTRLKKKETAINAILFTF